MVYPNYQYPNFGYGDKIKKTKMSALRPVAHSISKRFRVQNKEGCLPAEAVFGAGGRSDGAGAGTPSLRGVECRVGEARVLGFVSRYSVGKKFEQRLELLQKIESFNI
mgnify:CR=1 FL=1